MSHGNSSVRSIIYALIANFGIAIIKTIAAIITRSGSMLAEAIHSYADCGNQGLLFLGLRRSKRLPTDKYPLGYGKAIFFWSFIVALILFSMGGLFSIYEGMHKLHGHEGITSPYIAVGVLVFSILLELASLFGCLREIKKVRQDKKLWRWVKETRQSELVVVLGEDLAALFGLVLALAAILLTIITGNPVYDAMGSIAIGVLLIIISILIGVKIKGLLIGQSASPDDSKAIEVFLENHPKVAEVMNIITLQLGAKIMLAVKVKMQEKSDCKKLIADINQCEKELKQEIPAIQWIFFEPDQTS